MTRLRLVLILALACLALPALAAAQTPVLGPGQVFLVDVEAGIYTGPTGVLTPRPESVVVIQYRLGSNATPVDMVKRAPCVVKDAVTNVLTCQLVPPSMPAGPNVIAFRSRTQPPEAGVPVSDWSAPFGFTVAIVTPTGIPSNVRVLTVP